jgi:error-prone DNA polymerase
VNEGHISKTSSSELADTVEMFKGRAVADGIVAAKRPNAILRSVVQVAIIRPGPIVGQMMHSDMRRRQKKEAVTYPQP